MFNIKKINENISVILITFVHLHKKVEHVKILSNYDMNEQCRQENAIWDKEIH